METIVHYSESPLRIVDLDGEKWINANDVARALDYKNGRVATNTFINTNREILYNCVRKIRTQIDEFTGPGRGAKESWFFNEKGLMAFLMKTNQEKAIPFQKWAISVLAENLKKEVDKKSEQYKTLRFKSKRVRVAFTDTLKGHGYCIETTYMMKTRLGIDKYRPKNDLDIWELLKVEVSELTATARLSESEAKGFNNVNPIIEDAKECPECHSIVFTSVKHDCKN